MCCVVIAIYYFIISNIIISPIIISPIIILYYFFIIIFFLIYISSVCIIVQRWRYVPAVIVEIKYGTLHAKGIVSFFATDTLILAECQMKLERVEKW